MKGKIATYGYMHSLKNKTQVMNSSTFWQKNFRLNYSFSYWNSLIVTSAINSECSVLYSEDMQDGLQVHNKLEIINPLKQ